MKETNKDLITGLLQKPEFKQWVLNPTEESNYFWERWMKEHPSARESVLKAREIILRLKFGENRLGQEEENELLDRIISAPARIQRSKFTTRTAWLRYAAVITVAVLSGVAYLALKDHAKPSIEVAEAVVRTNPKGQRSVIQLPDGTRVHLNASSSLTYFSDYTQQRFVELNGEAYFEVERNPGNPFIVRSQEVKTTVLGTSFNIKNRGSSTEVLLVEGKVRVEDQHAPGDFLVLDPRQKVVHNEDSGLSPAVDAGDLHDILWTQGVIYFDNTVLPEVIRVLEDWYAVDIEATGDYESLQYSGKFQDEYLSNVLEAMSFSLDLEYELDDKKVKLKVKDSL